MQRQRHKRKITALINFHFLFCLEFILFFCFFKFSSVRYVFCLRYIYYISDFISSFHLSLVLCINGSWTRYQRTVRQSSGGCASAARSATFIQMPDLFPPSYNTSPGVILAGLAPSFAYLLLYYTVAEKIFIRVSSEIGRRKVSIFVFFFACM